jgi:3-oxoacyl-[acyl-carrier-protein] synthase-3
MTRAKIIGTGMCVPKYVLTNEELSGMVDTSDEWIVERTGIRERHIARDGETCLSLCTAASKQAIARAGIQASEIDMIIVASLTPDRVMPAMACELNAALGCNEPISFDLTAACSGFIFALSVADQFIRTGQKKTILCVGAELLSAYINWEDRATVVLFGDGAGAVVLQASNGPSGIMSTHTYSNGNYGELLCIPASGSKLAPSNPHFSKRR